MATTPTCQTHGANPVPECVDCESQFCADCTTPLTRSNSGVGMDVCEGCEAKADPYACIDARDEVWPEHDYTAAGGTECSRCGAEAHLDDEDDDF